MKTTFIAASASLCSAIALAGGSKEIIVDGVADAVYGDAAVVQGISTGFGNHTNSVPGVCNGSELDVAYGVIVGDAATGHLHLVLAGNLETNFNKLDIFIDARPGSGQNSLRNDNPNLDSNALNNSMGATSGGQAGLTFDPGFDADAVLFFTVGGPPAPYTMYTNYGQLLSVGTGVGGYVGAGAFDELLGAHVLPPTAIGDVGSGWQLTAALNNSNVGGVNGGAGTPSSGAGVVSGMEIKIPLAAVNWDGTSDIKVCAFITNGGHDYMSNQVLGGLPVGTANLATGRPNFAVIDGDQFFVVPASETTSSPIVMDGIAEAAYGPARATQGIATQFGDHLGGIPQGTCFGSELDAAYGAIVGDAQSGYLQLVLAGNLETNFNNLDLFIDARPGAGQNSLRSDNPQVGFADALNASMGAFEDAGVPQPGLTFDEGFDADAVVFVSAGGGRMYADYGQILSKGGGVGGFVGEAAFDASVNAYMLPPSPIGGAGSGWLLSAALNNSNIVGVPGNPDGIAASGAGVTTGLELKIPLAAIDWDGVSDIKVCAFISSNNHTSMSNQVLGSLPVGSTNLATGRPNFAVIDGNQYFVVSAGPGPNPCPADLNGDSAVDGQDLGVLLGSWAGPGAADLNGDGAVDGQDLGILLGAWGSCPQ
jgi:hypothetical protein